MAPARAGSGPSPGSGCLGAAVGALLLLGCSSLTPALPATNRVRVTPHGTQSLQDPATPTPTRSTFSTTTKCCCFGG